MEIDKISASALKTYDTCPLKFYALYVLGIPDSPPHPKTVMGSAIHKMNELASNQMIELRKKGDQTFVDPMLFKRQAIDEYKVAPDLHSTIDELVGNGVRWGYYRNIHRTAGCELRVEFNLPDGTLVKGFIDRLDLKPPEADILDIKTQGQAFTQEELDHNWQALIYNIGARRLYPEITGDVTVSFWVLRHQVQRVMKPAGSQDVDLELLQEKVSEIKANDDPQPYTSGLCQFCPYFDKCPASKENARSRLRRMSK